MRRNKKGQFVKRSSGAAVGARSGGARRGGGRRAKVASFARRAGGRLRGALPTITPMRVAKVTGGLIAGQALRRFIDVPYVSEEALGVLGVAMFSGPAEKGVLADVALALQTKEILDRFGVTDTILGFLPAGTPAGMIGPPMAPGTPVFDANGNQVGVA